MTVKKPKPVKPLTPIRIHRRDLPLSCPRPGVALWNLHPQVYLPIEKTGEESCPYCSAKFVLVD